MTFPPLAEAASQSIGRVVFAKGDVQLTRAARTRALSFNDDVYTMDVLETGDGELKVLFKDQTLLRLIAHSKVLISEHVYDPQRGIRKGIFDIIKGSVRTIVEKMANLSTDRVLLRTPTAVAGIRGTDVGTNVDKDITQYLCFEGLIETYYRKQAQTKVMVGPGLYTTIAGAPPTTPQPIPEHLRKKFAAKSTLKDVLSQDGLMTVPALVPTQGAKLPSLAGEAAMTSVSPAAETLLPGGANNIGSVITVPGSTGPAGNPGGGGPAGGPGSGAPSGPANNPGGGGGGGSNVPVTDAPVHVPTKFPEGG